MKKIQILLIIIQIFTLNLHAQYTESQEQRLQEVEREFNNELSKLNSEIANENTTFIQKRVLQSKKETISNDLEIIEKAKKLKRTINSESVLQNPFKYFCKVELMLDSIYTSDSGFSNLNTGVEFGRYLTENVVVEIEVEITKSTRTDKNQDYKFNYSFESKAIFDRKECDLESKFNVNFESIRALSPTDARLANQAAKNELNKKIIIEGVLDYQTYNSNYQRHAKKTFKNRMTNELGFYPCRIILTDWKVIK